MDSAEQSLYACTVPCLPRPRERALSGERALSVPNTSTSSVISSTINTSSLIASSLEDAAAVAAAAAATVQPVRATRAKGDAEQGAKEGSGGGEDDGEGDGQSLSTAGASVQARVNSLSAAALHVVLARSPCQTEMAAPFVQLESTACKATVCPALAGHKAATITRDA